MTRYSRRQMRLARKAFGSLFAGCLLMTTSVMAQHVRDIPMLEALATTVAGVVAGYFLVTCAEQIQDVFSDDR